MEIERRFLVAQDPPLHLARARHKIRQGYLAIDDVAKSSVRIRVSDLWEPMLTAKSGTGLSREEEGIALSYGDFVRLWPLTQGHRVEKVRHEIPDGDLLFELDVFGSDDSNARLVEVEFPSDAAARAFVPPPWFGREVTDDSRYTNAMIARHGFPE